MLLDTVIVVLGIAGLTRGADNLVFGASVLARNAGTFPLMIGLAVVAFGTLTPAIFSADVAARQDNPKLAIDNARG